MNATMEKFGYPGTAVREFDHWAILLRPAQVTLGSLVLAAKSEATSFAQLPPHAYAELALIVPAVEKALTAFCGFERINYLMLMMVDPHVHFHVFPRYSGTREWGGMDFKDHGWPGPPDLKSAVSLTPDQSDRLTNEVKWWF